MLIWFFCISLSCLCKVVFHEAFGLAWCDNTKATRTDTNRQINMLKFFSFYYTMYTIFITFSNSFNLKTADFYRTLLSFLKATSLWHHNTPVIEYTWQVCDTGFKIFFLQKVKAWYKWNIIIACWSVSLRLYTGNEKRYKPADQYSNVMFLWLYTLTITFLIV